jgi:hypothetical protein
MTRSRTTALAAAAAAALGLAHAAPGHAAALKHASCALKTVDLNPTAANDEDFGTLKCSGPFGAGVQHNTATLTPSSATAGTLSGRSTLYFSTGSVTAKFAVKYTLNGPVITFGGAAKVVGGTGAYKKIKGAAKLQGSSQDGGTHGAMTEKITFTLGR